MECSKPISLFAGARLCLGVLWLAGFLLTSSACAQEADAQSAQQDGVDQEMAEEKKARPTLDLGKFVINDLRPTRNETAKVTFSMHLAFSENLTEKQVRQLESWKHRLRDQVITATRISYLTDFQEPDLSRFRRKILIRVNRMFKAKLADDVLMTEYLFRQN